MLRRHLIAGVLVMGTLVPVLASAESCMARCQRRAEECAKSCGDRPACMQGCGESMEACVRECPEAQPDSPSRELRKAPGPSASRAP